MNDINKIVALIKLVVKFYSVDVNIKILQLSIKKKVTFSTLSEINKK